MLDAWATGGSAALAQYLELALQALVMTYGGLAILQGTDQLTVGALVTFQLYWGMLSAGFTNLFDQLGEFSKVIVSCWLHSFFNAKKHCLGGGCGAASAGAAGAAAGRGPRGGRAAGRGGSGRH